MSLQKIWTISVTNVEKPSHTVDILFLFCNFKYRLIDKRVLVISKLIALLNLTHTFACVLESNLFIVPNCSIWGISSDGRAPALHAGGTGIDTQILHFSLFFLSFFSFLLFFDCLHSFLLSFSSVGFYTLGYTKLQKCSLKSLICLL